MRILEAKTISNVAMSIERNSLHKSLARENSVDLERAKPGALPPSS